MDYPSVVNATLNAYSRQSINEFDHISHEFSKYHTDPMNVFLHFITTPLGFIGVFSLLRRIFKTSSPGMLLSLYYVLSLIPVLPNGELFGTAALLAIVLHLSSKLDLGYLGSGVCVVLGYLLQDMAHLATGEATFQSTYSAGGQVSFLRFSHSSN